MEIEYGHPFSKRKLSALQKFLRKAGLDYEPSIEFTVNILQDEEIIATGSLDCNIIKCIAVSESHQGEGLTATVITELQKEAFFRNLHHLFLFTKPENRAMFESLFFYTVAQTDDALLMENERNGIQNFIASLDCPTTVGVIGAIVANCNPFTLGHRYLIEIAANQCDWLHVFILSEDRSMFSAETRLALARRSTEDLPNVTLHPTGDYLISYATFPRYFIKDSYRVNDIQCQLDIEIFKKYFAPALNITRRYIGTEPLSPVTNAYNHQLKRDLPRSGIQVLEIPRMEISGIPVSASAVRAALAKNDFADLKNLVPPATYQYLLDTYNK
ncbi:MAG: [citrate (pro-3S)-lyase] ligase [Clostridiaceae bacterium]